MTEQPRPTDPSESYSAAAVDDGVYERLARHLEVLGMGLPYRQALIELLKENLTPAEAEISLLLPTRVAPMHLASVDEIAATTDMPREELAAALEDMACRLLLYSGVMEDGKRGYGLLQTGFGFPQSFFWGGEESEHAWNMAGMVAKYFNREVTKEAYAACPTKPYRYIPVGESISSDLQAVFPYHTMEAVVRQAQRFAVAHCPCRMAAKVRGRACGHPIEVCLKFDDLADYLIERGLGREVTREEALDIIKLSEEAGLVHFVDNAEGQVKHNCNCCGCSCWNVGSIRRRKIPRDDLMATYFMRTTDEDACVGCGACVDICPVQAVVIEDGVAVVDEEWCIGCGLCVPRCPTGAAGLKLRDDTDRVPAPDFCTLHEQILKGRGLR